MFSCHKYNIQSLLKRGFTPTLESLNHFLLFLSKAHRFNLIIHLFSQMNSNQLKPNAQTHSIFTYALLSLHHFEEAHLFLTTHMTKTSLFPDIRSLDSLIQGFCIKREQPEKALLVLKDFLTNHGILPSSFTFCSLIHSFCSQGAMSIAVEVLELMTYGNVKYPFNNFVCTCVVSGFCKIGKPELAIGFFENAISLGTLRPNVVSYTALVTALCMLGRVNEVNNLLIRIENEGLVADVVFYSSWICGFFREGSLLEAFRKHRQMLDKGIKLDAISYSILVDGFSKEGHVEKAVGILHKMIKDGFRPNLITYTAIILGFCKQGKLEQALTVFNKVAELGIIPDEFVYATLIDGVCRKGDLDRAFRLLEDMEKRGVKPSVVTYNTVINGLCKIGRTSEADDFSKGILGDVITYSTLLHGYIEEDNKKGMLETRERFEQAGIRMDVILCNILIKALFMVGAPEDAHAFYQAMSEMDLVANSVTYCTMIDGYCKVGRIEEALEIFDEFRRTSISSVECYHSIINRLCNKGMVDMAIEVFIELNEKGFGLDVGICKILIKATFAKAGIAGVLDLVKSIKNLEPAIYDFICNHVIHFLSKRVYTGAAVEVFMLMRSRGSVVTSKSFHSILKGLTADAKKWLFGPLFSIFVKEYGLAEPMVRKTVIHYLGLNDIDKGLWFVKNIKEIPSAVTFPATVLKELIKEGRVLDAYKLVKEAEDCLPYIDVVDYSVIIDSLCKEGYLNKALNVCAFARNKGITLNIVTFNSVINSLCSQGCLVEAFRLFDSLERIDLVPSEVTYAMLIDNLCKQGLFVDAKKMFERMLLKALKPNTRIYNSFIDGYCKFGQMDEALKLLHDLEKEGLIPDTFTVSAVINGLCRKGDMEGALRFFFHFKGKDISPDFLGFLYLIRGLYTKGRMEEARSVLREMLQSNSVLEVINRVDTEVELESVGSILVLLCEQGSIKEAVAVLNEVGSMFFAVRRWSANCGSKKPDELCKCESLAAVASQSVLFYEQTDLKMTENSHNLENWSQFQDFDFFYSRISSLCSKGELSDANQVMRKLLSSWHGDS